MGQAPAQISCMQHRLQAGTPVAISWPGRWLLASILLVGSQLREGSRFQSKKDHFGRRLSWRQSHPISDYHGNRTRFQEAWWHCSLLCRNPRLGRRVLAIFTLLCGRHHPDIVLPQSLHWFIPSWWRGWQIHRLAELLPFSWPLSWCPPIAVPSMPHDDCWLRHLQGRELQIHV